MHSYESFHWGWKPDTYYFVDLRKADETTQQRAKEDQCSDNFANLPNLDGFHFSDNLHTILSRSLNPAQPNSFTCPEQAIVHVGPPRGKACSKRQISLLLEDTTVRIQHH